MNRCETVTWYNKCNSEKHDINQEKQFGSIFNIVFLENTRLLNKCFLCVPGETLKTSHWLSTVALCVLLPKWS